MSSLVQVFQISAHPFVPLSANYRFDSNVDLQSVLQQWNNGLTVFQIPFLNNTMDVKMNKSTAFYLTSAIPLNTIIDDKAKSYTKTFSTGKIAIKASNGKYVTNTGNTLYATADTIDTNETFTLIPNDDGTISLQQNRKLIFVDEYTPWNLKVATTNPTTEEIARSKFEFIEIDEGGISKFILKSISLYDKETPTGVCQNVVQFERFISLYEPTSNIRAIGTTQNSASKFEIVFIDLGTYIPTQIYNGFEPNTWWYKYFNNALKTKDGANVIPNYIQSISALKLNYLIDIPYKTNIQTGWYDNNLCIGNFNVDIATLKNIETVNYEYTIIPTIVGNNATLDTTSDNVKIREYQRIFTGTNQERGYENVHMSYSTNFAKTLVLEPDKNTYFHYPTIAPRLSLSSVGLEYIGAFAGETPERSDRIYKKMANYKNDIWWGDSLQWQTGVWLCSWLSGNSDPNTRPVWMDRWYNPGYLQQDSILGPPVYINNDPVIQDVPSVMTFDPGVYYYYHHQGNNGAQIIVNSLSGEDGSLKLHYDSIYDLNSENEIRESYNDECNPTNCLSYTAWVYADDWTNAKSSHIIGNYYRGGWDLRFSNGFFTPIYSIYDTASKYIVTFNINNDSIMKKAMPVTVAPQICALTVDRDMFTWALDIANKKIHKIDYNGNILSQIVFSPSETVTDLAIDGNQVVWVYNSLTQQASGFNNITTSIVSTVSGLTGTRIDVDLNNNIFAVMCDDLCVDNDNNIWCISGDNVLVNSTPVSTLNIAVSSPVKITCDRDNNIWLLNNTTTIVKYDYNNDEIIWTKDIGTSSTVNLRSIDFINKYDAGDSTYYDYAIVVQAADNRIYVIDTDGVVNDRINTNYIVDASKLPAGSTYTYEAIGDFTGYQWCRKFDYIKNNSEEHISSEILLRSENSTEYVDISYPTTNLANGWHHFATTFTQGQSGLPGHVKFYIDTTLISSVETPIDYYIYYEYETPLIVGGNTGAYMSLNSEIDTTQYYFDGKIKDLKIYDCVLNNSDISYIYLLNFDFNSIIWNIPTSSQCFVEEVERFFKNKIPGMKSHRFTIKLRGLQITEPEIRTMIEDIIKSTIYKVAPLYTELYTIVWE